VIARRLPAARPGKGGAARYVSGKMPANARSSLKPEMTTSHRAPNGGGATVKNSMSDLNSAQTEDEKIKALFNLQANQWKEQQEEMAK
jgi:protein MPE1